MALTERQQEIVDLQKQGKKAKEIGAALGISENAVYQQLRRIRNGQGGTSTGTRGRTTEAAATPSTSRRQSGRRRGSAAPTLDAPGPSGNSSPAAAPRAVTPLQAVRARRDDVMADLRAAEHDVQEAQKALDAATKQRDRVAEKVRPELATLDAAEAALQGKLTLEEATGEQPASAEAEAQVQEKVEEAQAEAAKAPQPPTETPKGTRGRGRRSQAATPSTQTEREANQDEFDAAEAEAAQQAAEAPQTPAPVPAA